MKNKTEHLGFTLIELLGVVLILGIVILLSWTAISKFITQINGELSDSTRQMIMDGTKDYINKNKLLYPKKEGNIYCISLTELVEQNLISEKAIANYDISNKKVKITFNGHKEVYEIVEATSCEEVKLGVTIKLYGDSVINLPAGSTYNDAGALATNAYGSSLGIIVRIQNRKTKAVLGTSSPLNSIGDIKTYISGVIDTSQLGEYVIEYVATDGGITASTSRILNIKSNQLVAGNTGGTSVSAPYLSDTADLYRNQIISIEIVDHKNIPGNAVGSYDVSSAQNGAVMLWYVLDDETDLYKVYIGAVGGVYANEDSGYLFSALSNIKEIKLTHLNTSMVSNMSHMFESVCYMGVSVTGVRNNSLPKIENKDKTKFLEWVCDPVNIDSIEFGPNFITSNVIDMSYMFRNILINGYIKHQGGSNNVINFDTSKVIDMRNMFTSVNFNIEFGPKFVTSNVLYTSSMFADASLTQIKHTGGSNNVINFDTSKVKNMSYMFWSTYLNTIEFGPNFITNNVEDMSGMFSGMSNLTLIKHTGGSNNVINFNTSKVVSMQHMFSSTKLTSIEFGLNFVTTNVEDMTYMVGGMTNLIQIKHTGGSNNVINFDTSKVKNMSYMFNGTQLSTIEFGLNFVTTNVEDMYAMFSNMTNLTQIKHTGGSNNVINFDTSKVKNMSSMFNGTKLNTIEFGLNFVTTNVEAMTYMFSNMTNLTLIKHTGGANNELNFNTSNAYYLGGMFEGDISLTNLKFGTSFVTDNVYYMDEMFYGMTSLTSLDLRNFDFSRLTHLSMYRDMMYNVPTSVNITLSSVGKTWFISKFPAYANITVA